MRNPNALVTLPVPSRSSARSATGTLILQRLVIAVVFIAVIAVLSVTVTAAAMEVVRSAEIGQLHVGGLMLTVGAEGLSLVGFILIPGWLLRSQGLILRGRDLLKIGMASNAISVLVPGGSLASSVWAGRQYHRRSVPAPMAAWTVLGGGFASTVTLLLLAVVGAALDGLIAPLVALLAVGVVIAGSSAVLAMAHQGLARLEPSSDRTGHWPRLIARVRVVLSAAGSFRAGRRSGAAVLGLATVNWSADALVLAGAFLALGVPVPWAGLLFAYCAAQGAGALLPIPGGVGAVEGGLLGGLVLAGSAPHRAVAVIAVYRAVGYWAPAAAGVVPFVAARRNHAALPVLTTSSDDDHRQLRRSQRRRSPLEAVRVVLAKRHGLATEVAMLIGAYVLYDFSRGLVRGGASIAQRHAQAVAGVERHMSIFIESDVQHALSRVPGIMHIFGFGYDALHLGVTAAVLLWLYLRRPTVFPLVRTTLIVAVLTALTVFALFPTAPPRLAGLGINDSLSLARTTSHSSVLSALYNPYAAMPSLHIAFAVIAGGSVAIYARHRWARFTGIVYLFFVGVEVIATGNHFLLDVAAGAATAAASSLISRKVLAHGARTALAVSTATDRGHHRRAALEPDANRAGLLTTRPDMVRAETAIPPPKGTRHELEGPCRPRSSNGDPISPRITATKPAAA